MFGIKLKTTPELEQAIAAYANNYTAKSAVVSRYAVRPFVFDIDFGSAIVRIGQEADGRIYMYGWTGYGKEPSDGPRRAVYTDKQGTFFGQFVNGRWTTISTTVTGWEWRTKKYQYPTRRK